MKGVSAHQRRKCVACAESAPKRELLRMVWDGTCLRVDPRQVLQRRGAYLHPVWSCVEQARDAKRWERALRLAAGTLPKDAAAAVREFVNEAAGAERGPRKGKVRL